MSPQKKIQLGLLSVLLLIAVILTAAIVTRPASPPTINGVLLPEALALKDFALVDHNNRPFTQQQLLGQWHIVSYGYTYCPDICPTTLTTLAHVARKLERDEEHTNTRFLFYTVDPERDTVSRLAEYMPWFNEDFVGLTTEDRDASSTQAFERSLGIMGIITPLEMDEGLEDYGGYTVSHGVALYLINPEGQLQAVLKPAVDKDGTQFYTVDQVYDDYRKIRHFLG